jgi:hypothetical protein
MAIPRPVPGNTAATLTSITALCDAADQATANIAELQFDIGNEANARAAAIAVEASNRAAAIAAEASDRNSQVQQESERRQRNVNDLTQSQQAIQANVTAEVADRKAAIAATLEKIVEANAYTDTKLFAALVAIVTDAMLPGICPAAFSNSAIGSIGSSSPVDPALCVPTPFGAAYSISAAGLVAPRAAFLVDPNAIWALQVRFWRASDVSDPNNDALDIGIQWLDANDASAGTTLIQRRRNLVSQNGPQSLTVRVPSIVGNLPSIVPPMNAVSWRPYLRTYGADGATAILQLGAQDVTFAGVFAPDLTALAGRVTAVEGQVKVGFAEKLDRAFLVLPDDPTPDDIPPGTIRAVKNASTGRHSIWANDAGIMVDYGLLATS